MNLFLGVHHPNWLATSDVPLFVSRCRLEGRKSFPRASAPWALDSGAFSELSLRGGWSISEWTYAALARRWKTEIGNMLWAAPMDWMCEPTIIKRTGLSVWEHQTRTIDSFVKLCMIDTGIHFIPVLQGWRQEDYLRHIEMYRNRGVELERERLVGVGTICRRQGTNAIASLLSCLANTGLKLHGFGVKLTGIRKGGQYLHSADSMAWSFEARRSSPLPGHTHKNCANCWEWARGWFDKARYQGSGGEVSGPQGTVEEG